MIISELAGGLGNQMFQYAAGRALSLRYDTRLKLDRSFLDADARGKYTKRTYELNVFALDAEFASAEETRPVKRKGDSRLSRVLHRQFPFLFSSLYIAENTHQYMPRFWKYGPNAYLHGFWQSEKYFRPYRDAIRKDFTFREQAKGRNAEMLDLIRKTHSVSVHIRRGDYVNDANVNAYHGLAGIAYYEAAVREIEKIAGAPELFVFSDDIEWCRQHLLLGYPTHFMDHNNGSTAFEDMRLMSECRHNIIANSSFSWWAAWLNANPNKIVTAPRQWFRNEANPDIYPADWIKL